MKKTKDWNTYWTNCKTKQKKVTEEDVVKDKLGEKIINQGWKCIIWILIMQRKKSTLRSESKKRNSDQKKYHGGVAKGVRERGRLRNRDNE